MNKQKIKKLAFIAASNPTIPKDIEEFVLTRLTKQQLKDFLRFYKLELDKARVYISTASELTSQELVDFKKVFRNKELITTVEKSLGAGILLKQNDTIIDFTIKSIINETIDRLKN